MKTRLYVRALIQRGDDVLVNMTKHGPKLLGGKVEPDEWLRAALARELLEELGVRATIGSMVHVDEMAVETVNSGIRKLEFVFKVRLDNQELFETRLEYMKPKRKFKRLEWMPRTKVCGWNNVIHLDTSEVA